MTRSLTQITAGLVGVALAASAAQAQDPEAIRRQLLLGAAGTGPVSITDFFRGSPGTNTGTPLAFGPNTGTMFVGGGYQNETRALKRPNGTFDESRVTDDGSVSFGFGLGNATTGVTLTTVVTSLSTFRSGFGNRAAFSFQLSRNVQPTLGVAVGVENAFLSGGGQSDGSESFYGVISKVYQQPSADVTWLKAITVSGGVGNGRFRQLDDVNSDNETVNVFGSLAFTVHDKVSLIGDYTGQDINIGMSIVPFKKFPVSLTPALADITSTANSKARFILGAGLGLQF